jgi:CHAD domain-containing protein
MAYLIRRKESVAAEIRRILVEQNRRALALLASWQENPRDHVHQARQAFKRIRALLRLIRPGVCYVYRVENVFYRDLGRNLAYARDTEAVIEALGLLEARVSGPLAQESLRMLRVGLEQRAARERDCGLHDLPGRIKSACDALADAERRFRDLPLESLKRKDLRRGMQTTVERCASAFERVTHTQAPDDFHAWRKDVKYAYYQSRLMQQMLPRWAGASDPALGTLADVLGHYHDLVMLDALLHRQADELNMDVHLRAIRNAVRTARAEYAAEALVTVPKVFSRGGPPGNNVVELSSRA